MTDPITTSYVASSYGVQVPILRISNEGSYKEEAKQNQITKALYHYNADMIQMSSEVFAKALEQEQTEASVFDIQAETYGTQADAFNAYATSQYRGNQLNMEV